MARSDSPTASGLVGSETLNAQELFQSMGEMEITPVSGIVSGCSKSTLGKVTLTMATAGQSITYTAGSLVVLAACVPHLLVLNTKDAWTPSSSESRS